MRIISIALCIAALLVVGCKHSGKRVKAKDSHCKRNNKLAYAFDTSAEADKAGCDLVRVHMGKADPKTGQMQDFEDVLWCCAR